MNRKILLEDMKSIELNILDIVDKICKENNLKYSLIGGSLIGAIRHQGFIPWDDDIDICMPRPDYEKLINIMNSSTYKNVKILSFDLQSDYYYPYAKVVATNTTLKEYRQYVIKDYGVFIDIFPVDGTNKNCFKAIMQMVEVKVLRKLLELSFHEEVVSQNEIKKIIKKCMFGISHKLGYKKILNRIDKISQKCKYENSEYATILYSAISTKHHKKYKRDFFTNTIYTKFEGRDIQVFEDYDKILKDEFGDYMKLPPIEKQKSNHFFEIVEWKL